MMELLRPAHGILLDLADDARLREVAAPRQDRVAAATVRPEPGERTLSAASALLVRPDGCVAWAAGHRGPAAAAVRAAPAVRLAAAGPGQGSPPQRGPR
jgi:bifunctional hydroxylase/dehydrase